MKIFNLKIIDWSEVGNKILAYVEIVILTPLLLPYFLIKEIIEDYRERKEGKEEPKKLSREERCKLPPQHMFNEHQVEMFDIMGMSSKELVYVANEECMQLNDIFENHPEVIARWEEITGYTIVYLPNLRKKFCDWETLSYRYPWMTDFRVEPSPVGNDYLLQQLIHQEDREKMLHGFLRTDTSYTFYGGGPTWLAFYYPLEIDGTVPLDVQVCQIALFIKQETQLGGVFCSKRDTAGDDEADFADNNFVSQKWEEDIHDLMDEVRERIQKLRQRGVAEHLLEELLHPEEQLSKMVITKDYRIFLPGFNNMEITMEPLVKAVYFLFLNHPKGLYFKELPDYRKELTKIYLKLKPNGLTPQMQRSIEDVTNPLSNSINEKCARIRAAFLTQFDDRLAQHYYITGQRANPKLITLPRELVVWE